jgi:hypothetical protein
MRLRPSWGGGIRSVIRSAATCFHPLQIVVVIQIPSDDEFLMAEFEGTRGKLPSTYIEYI